MSRCTSPATAARRFTALKGAPGGDDYHFLWLDPDDTSRMVVASDQGTVVSVDGGKSWTSWFNQPTAQFYHVTTDNQFPYYVYGAQQDSGTVATTSRSDYGSITYRDWYSIGAGESGYIAPDPSDPNTVYGGSTYGRLFRFDKRTGQSQDISPTAVEEWTHADHGEEAALHAGPRRWCSRRRIRRRCTWARSTCCGRPIAGIRGRRSART